MPNVHLSGARLHFASLRDGFSLDCGVIRIGEPECPPIAKRRLDLALLGV